MDDNVNTNVLYIFSEKCFELYRPRFPGLVNGFRWFVYQSPAEILEIDPGTVFANDPGKCVFCW